MVSDVLLRCLMNLHFIVHFTGNDMKLSISSFFLNLSSLFTRIYFDQVCMEGGRVQGRQEMRHTER